MKAAVLSFAIVAALALKAHAGQPIEIFGCTKSKSEATQSVTQ